VLLAYRQSRHRKINLNQTPFSFASTVPTLVRLPKALTVLSVRTLQAMVNGLVSENIDLKKCIQKTEQKLADLEKLIRETLES